MHIHKTGIPEEDIMQIYTFDMEPTTVTDCRCSLLITRESLQLKSSSIWIKVQILLKYATEIADFNMPRPE